MKDIQYRYSDGGKEESSYKYETLDCVVRAYAIAYDCPYYKAHELIASFGRKDRHRFNARSEFMPALNLVHTLMPHCTVNTFVSENISGIYLVRIKGHIFCVKNGIIFDSYFDYGKSRVIEYWKVK